MIDMLLGVIIPIPVGSIWRKLRNAQKEHKQSSQQSELLGGWLNTERNEDENTRYNSDGQRIN